MDKPCSFHNNPIIAICLYKGCDKTLLCLKCLRDHNEDHDSLTNNVYDLVKNQDWLEPYEKQRDELVLKEKDISAQRSAMISSSQNLLKAMMSSVAKIAEDQKERLLEELNEVVDADRNQEIKDLFSKLEADTETLQEIKFRDGDDLERIIKVKKFNETMVLNAEELTKQVEDTLKSWTLDENKMNLYKEELIDLLQSIHLKDLLASTPFKSIKETDTFSALRATNERLEHELKNKTELLENQTQKQEVKTDDDDIRCQLAKALSERDELLNQNCQLKETITDLELTIESLNNHQEEMKNQNAILDREVSQLAAELSTMKRRNSLPPYNNNQILDRRVQSLSGNGLFG